MATTADSLKRSGNVPTNAAYFTNRALTRVRMEQWDAVVTDCEKAIELLPTSLKAYTYLGSALLHLNRPAESFTASQKAYQLAISQRSPSIPQIAASCLEAKKARWEVSETARIARESSLLRETQETILREAKAKGDKLRSTGMYGGFGIAGEEAAKEMEEEGRRRCRELEDVFGKAEAETLRRRVVPEWLVDNITFGVMWDPVVTKHGQSYDRSTLIDHLKRSQTDPLTREPLMEEDLRPNLALKAASEEFLKENGWAVDW
ncbi:hypothetical protein BDD12DRAFT_852937 [Trichophaea hybrida]|nr:hypothetical protein BDD12DRAFT_852937 [Trichophaea hybrida]